MSGDGKENLLDLGRGTSLTKQKNRIFLEKLIETRNFAEAKKAAGVCNVTANALLAKYSNIYKAMFEKIGLTEENVLRELKTLIINPEDVVIDRYTGRKSAVKDKRMQLAAIETYGKLTGAIQSGTNVNVVVQNNTEVDNRTIVDQKIYENIKNSGSFDQVQQTVLDAIEKANKEA